MNHQSFESWILPTYFVGYTIGFLICMIIYPIKNDKFYLKNIIFSILIYVPISLPCISLSFLILGFTTDSSSAYDNLYALLYPIVFSLLSTVPGILLKLLIGFFVTFFIRIKKLRAEKNKKMY